MFKIMQTNSKSREAVGIFSDEAALQDAIDELLRSGFDRAELSLLANERTVERRLGQSYVRRAELEDDPRAPRADYISPESIGDAQGGLIAGLMYAGAIAATGVVIASGGTLIAVFAAAALAGGVGGFAGSILDKLIDDHHAQFIQDQLDRGGLLLWVYARDSRHEKRAVDILMKHSARDVHVHSLCPNEVSQVTIKPVQRAER